MSGFPAEFMPSANPRPELCAGKRNDPYWDPNWVPGSQAVWSNKSSLITPNMKLDLSTDQALAILLKPRRRATALSLMAALDSWSTLTAEQAAAISGDPALLDPRTQVPAALFALGIMDIGRYPGAFAGRSATDTWLYRRSTGNAFNQLVAPKLTWPEWVSVTGGYPWSTTTSFDRHNVLATELAIRCAEYLGPAAVLGEKFTHAGMLVTGAAGATPPQYTNRADGLIVLPNGLRVALEITASRSKTLEAKIERWAKILREHPLETSGLIVLFVTAPHPGAGKTSGNEVRKAVTKVLRSHPGRTKDSPSARIGVVDWSDWFPARHQLANDFFTMNTRFATGPAGDDRWVGRSIMSMSFDSWEKFDAQALSTNSKLLAHVPHWLRTGDHTSLIGSPMDRSGMSLPVMPALRPDVLAGRPSRGGRSKRGFIASLPNRLRVRA